MAPRGKELSQDMKDLIIKLYKDNKSQRQIAKDVNKTNATIQKLLKNLKEKVLPRINQELGARKFSRRRNAE